MLDPIWHYSLTNPASVYDEEALTALELAGRTAKKVNQTIEQVNELITDNNQHEQSVEEKITAQNDRITKAIQTMNNNLGDMWQEIRNDMQNRTEAIFVHSYMTKTGERYPNTPPIYFDGNRIVISAGYYYTPSKTISISNDSYVSLPDVSTGSNNYYLVYSVGDIIGFKTAGQITYSDVILCVCLISSDDVVKIFNYPLLSYIHAINKTLTTVKNTYSLTGYWVYGCIEIDTVNKTFRVSEESLVSLPAPKKTFAVIPAESNPRTYTDTDGYMMSFYIDNYQPDNDKQLVVKYGTPNKNTDKGDIFLYLGSFGNGLLYSNNFDDSFTFIIDGVKCRASELFYAAENPPEKDYTEEVLQIPSIDVSADSQLLIKPDNFCLSVGNRVYTDNLHVVYNHSTNVIDFSGLQDSETINLYIIDNKAETIGHVNFNVNKKLNGPITGKKVLFISDDMVDNNYFLSELKAEFDANGDTVTFLGTQQTSQGYRHEGRAQWRFGDYTMSEGYAYAGKSNPFNVDGLFRTYLNTIGDTPDLIYIWLGTNDVGQGTRLVGDSSASIYAEKAYKLVNYIRTDFQGKICIILPMTGNKAFNGRSDQSPERFHVSINRLNKALLDRFRNEAILDVKFFPLFLFTDDGFYPADDLVHPANDPGSVAQRIRENMFYFIGG